MHATIASFPRATFYRDSLISCGSSVALSAFYFPTSAPVAFTNVEGAERKDGILLPIKEEAYAVLDAIRTMLRRSRDLRHSDIDVVTPHNVRYVCCTDC